jgi:putative transposase
MLAPEQVNQGWAMDFLSDWVVGPDGEKVRIINIMDECSRRALWTEAHKNITADTLVGILEKVAEWRGLPAYIRCDNGPEFISDALSKWAKEKTEIKHIQPGKPSQNGLMERLNKTLRTECLNLEWFKSIEELNQKIQDWSVTYNYSRPHGALKYKSPCTFEKTREFYLKTAAA